MKNLLALLFVFAVGLSACSSNNNDEYYFYNNSPSNLTPPAWIIGTWVYENDTASAETIDLTYQFTTDNFLIMGNDTLDYKLAIEEADGGIVIDLQKYTAEIYILDIALNDSTNAYYKFVKTNTAQMKQVQMDDEGVWFFNQQ